MNGSVFDICADFGSEFDTDIVVSGANMDWMTTSDESAVKSQKKSQLNESHRKSQNAPQGMPK